jgi:hypothetical protein
VERLLRNMTPQRRFSEIGSKVITGYSCSTRARLTQVIENRDHPAPSSRSPAQPSRCILPLLPIRRCGRPAATSSRRRRQLPRRLHQPRPPPQLRTRSTGRTSPAPSLHRSAETGFTSASGPVKTATMVAEPERGTLRSAATRSPAAVESGSDLTAGLPMHRSDTSLPMRRTPTVQASDQEYSPEVTNFSTRPLVELQPGLEKNDIDLRTRCRREDEGREQDQGSLLYLSRCSSSGAWQAISGLVSQARGQKGSDESLIYVTHRMVLQEQ